jgi:hypothetical protein
MSAGEIMTSSHVDLDYVKLAAQLQSQCMQIITHCLKQVPDDAEGKYTFKIDQKNHFVGR